MAATIVDYDSLKQDISRIPQWFVFELTSPAVVAGNDDTNLMELSEGVSIDDIKLSCIKAGSGATSHTWSVRYNDSAGPATTLLPGTTDNGAVLGVTEVNEMLGMNRLPSPGGDASSAATLSVRYATVGSSTVSSGIRLSLLMHRRKRASQSGAMVV